MSITFSADEVFEIAEQIERNGQKFYSKAADIVDQDSAQQLLLKLAKWEVRHEELFAEMREALKGSEKPDLVYDPDDQGVLYLRSMADGEVFNLRADLSKRLEGGESLEDIFGIALEAEKNSVLYYVGMKAVVPEKLGQEKIDGIIQEEMNHITILTSQLEALKK